jgi:hypothetical protein
LSASGIILHYELNVCESVITIIIRARKREPMVVETVVKAFSIGAPPPTLGVQYETIETSGGLQAVPEIRVLTGALCT